jgi:hypothetical protein
VKTHVACSNCHIPLMECRDAVLCDVCASMSAAVCRPWFHTAQAEMVEENDRRRKLKQRLMAGNERA